MKPILKGLRGRLSWRATEGAGQKALAGASWGLSGRAEEGLLCMHVVGGEGGGQVNNGSQHVSLALAIDVGLRSTPRFHRGWQCLYRRVSQHGPQRPMCACLSHPGLTFEHGADPPEPQAALTCKLAKGEFHEEEGDPAEDEHDEVGEHEGSWWAGEGWLRAGFGGSHPLPAQNPTAEPLQLAGLPGGGAMAWTGASV